MKNAIALISRIMNERMKISLCAVLLMLAWTIACDDAQQSTGVAVRHFYVSYDIAATTTTTATIYAEFRVRDQNGELIELGGDDTISVNGSLMAQQYVDDDDESDEFYYSASIATSAQYTFVLTKDHETYVDVVDMPAPLTVVNIPSDPIQKNNIFTIGWDNYEADSFIVFKFYTTDETKYITVPDDPLREYTGDNSSWLTSLSAGQVNIYACRIKNYSLNRSFQGGEIRLQGPYTNTVSFTLAN